MSFQGLSFGVGEEPPEDWFFNNMYDKELEEIHDRMVKAWFQMAQGGTEINDMKLILDLLKKEEVNFKQMKIQMDNIRRLSAIYEWIHSIWDRVGKEEYRQPARRGLWKDVHDKISEQSAMTSTHSLDYLFTQIERDIKRSHMEGTAVCPDLNILDKILGKSDLNE